MSRDLTSKLGNENISYVRARPNTSILLGSHLHSSSLPMCPLTSQNLNTPLKSFYIPKMSLKASSQITITSDSVHSFSIHVRVRVP